jgi:hypothetical protein
MLRRFVLNGFIIACLAFVSNNPSSFNVSFHATIDTFDFANRLQLFSLTDSIASMLWNAPSFKIIKHTATKTFTELPVLQLIDRNNDGVAEEFAYAKNERASDTREFGFFFDTNRDGNVDYLVYNGGPMFTEGFAKMLWMNYHAIDRNGDGKVDIFIFNGVSLGDDGMMDEGKSAWLYDNNYDGIFETGEYLGKNFQQAIEKKDDEFQIKTCIGIRTWKDDNDMSFWNAILKDINSLK